jgi:hypothetical protein
LGRWVNAGEVDQVVGACALQWRMSVNVAFIPCRAVSTVFIN